MKRIAAILALSFFLPLVAFAQTNPAYQYQRQGIFDCNQNGSFAMSIGSLAATGGTYVPVADATVELNTGILVYKECVLREVVDRMRESATASYQGQAYRGILTGRDGNPLYVQNRGQEKLTGAYDPAFNNFVNGNSLNALSPTLQGPIKRALQRNYDIQRNNPQSILKCPYQSNSTLIWDSVLSVGTVCNPIVAYYPAQELSGIPGVLAAEDMETQWMYGRGYYPRYDSNGKLITPAVNVQESFQTWLDSPVRQLESANDVGQMIGALFAGVTTQIIGGDGGLAGLGLNSNGVTPNNCTQTGGATSYLCQISQQTGEGLRNSAANVGIVSVNGFIQVETQYLQAFKAMADAVTKAVGQLKGAQNQCWDLVIKQVCGSGSLNAQNECTNGGSTYRVATSSPDFAQNVIQLQVGTLAASAPAEVASSQATLAKLNKLQADLTNDATRQAALQAADQLNPVYITRRVVAANASQQASAVVSVLTDPNSGIVAKAVIDWADGTPNGQPFSASNATGWCNVNNTVVVDAWKARWKK